MGAGTAPARWAPAGIEIVDGCSGTVALDGVARATYRNAVRDAAAAGCSAVVATHDVEEAARSDHAMLLARRVIAYGSGRDVLTPQALLSTFGMVAHRGEGGALIVEHDHAPECDGGGPAIP